MKKKIVKKNKSGKKPRTTEIVHHSRRTLAPPINATVSPGQAIENVLIKGDLMDLKPEERVDYYRRVCNSLGLNILTRPFDYILFKEPGSDTKKLSLYANKSCTEQLRKIHCIGVKPAFHREIDQSAKVVIVSVEVYELRTGKTDAATGVVSLQKRKYNSYELEDLTGTEYANAIMKAETKAKRRATLSISGLAVLDETELDTMHIVGGVTPEGRIYEYAQPRLPADATARELSEEAATGHPDGSRKAEQAKQQLSKVEEEEQFMLTCTDAEEIAKRASIPIEAAKNIAERNAKKGKKEGKVQSDIPPAKKVDPPKERQPQPGQPMLEVETVNPDSFIVRGDVQTLYPMVSFVCKFVDGWWRCNLEGLKKMQSVEEEHKFFIKVLATPAKQKPAAAAPASKSQEKRKAAQTAPAKPAEPTTTIKGTITGAIEGTAGTAPVRRVTLETSDGKKFTMSCFDKDLFPFLDKSLGQIAEFVTKKNKQWTNIIGALKIGATEFVDGKIPVVQQKDQPAGTLFEK